VRTIVIERVLWRSPIVSYRIVIANRALPPNTIRGSRRDRAVGGDIEKRDRLLCRVGDLKRYDGATAVLDMSIGNPDLRVASQRE
jgi:hypothetical protein